MGPPRYCSRSGTGLVGREGYCTRCEDMVLDGVVKDGFWNGEPRRTLAENHSERDRQVR